MPGQQLTCVIWFFVCICGHITNYIFSSKVSVGLTITIQSLYHFCSPLGGCDVYFSLLCVRICWGFTLKNSARKIKYISLFFYDAKLGIDDICIPYVTSSAMCRTYCVYLTYSCYFILNFIIQCFV